MADEQGIAVIGLTLARDANVFALLSSFAEPIDAEEIGSTIHAVTIVDEELTGEPIHSDDTWLTALSSPDGARLFAVSMEGLVHFFDGARWSVVKTEAADGLNDVYATGPSTAFAVGVNGEIVRIDGGSAVSVLTTGTRLNAIHGLGTAQLCAVGDEGQILRDGPDGWKAITPLTNANLLAVHVAADGCVYVGGADGTAFRHANDDWEVLDAGGATITSIAVFHNAVYAAAGEAGVMRLEGTSFVPFKKLGLDVLCADDKLLYGCGGNLFCWFDGSEWIGSPYTEE